MAKGDGEVKLLGAWPSIFVMRARIALNLKSVDYEYVVETMQPKSELLLKSNPIHKKIPVLLHNDKHICESLIIVQYIDEVWSSSGPSILPTDPYDRIIQRFWAAYVDDKWFPSILAIFKAQKEEEKAAAIQQVKEGLALLEGTFYECSKGKPFFGGDKIGYLDITLGSFLCFLKANERINDVKLLDQAMTPALVAWANHFCANDAVKDVMPEIEKLMEFFKTVIA